MEQSLNPTKIEEASKIVQTYLYQLPFELESLVEDLERIKYTFDKKAYDKAYDAIITAHTRASLLYRRTPLAIRALDGLKLELKFGGKYKEEGGGQIAGQSEGAIELGQETPVDKAIAKAEAVLREALAKKEPLIEQWGKLVDIANEAPMPYDALIRRLKTTMVLFLAEDEKRIPDFASRFSRCVLHLATKAGKPGGVRNPFAACRAHLRKLVGLKPLTKREYGLAVSQTMEATSKTPF